ncbi:non-structural maintenance of chromosomes element 3 homolog [Chironomus tepperi]|uniref:non-structural maintenance of chromosomes element 3 homolog n=1 Tax=Chironomus tepperi TaxID=113505 RepID=UPI00391F53BB
MPRRTTRNEPSTSTATPMEYDSDNEGESSNQDIELLVTNFVKYIINYSANKLPIKRNELVKQLKINQKQFPQVFLEGKKILNEIYGIELSELSETKPTKLYIAYSTFKLPTPSMLNKETAAEMKTLFIVLSYIFMKSGEIQEGNLNNFLEKVHINLEEFAKTREKFVKQMYLKRHKVQIEGQNESHTYYSWGERALMEFSKQDILEQVSKLVRKPSSNFIVQHREVYGEDPNEDSIMLG